MIELLNVDAPVTANIPESVMLPEVLKLEAPTAPAVTPVNVVAPVTPNVPPTVVLPVKVDAPVTAKVPESVIFPEVLKLVPLKAPVNVPPVRGK